MVLLQAVYVVLFAIELAVQTHIQSGYLPIIRPLSHSGKIYRCYPIYYDCFERVSGYGTQDKSYDVLKYTGERNSYTDDYINGGEVDDDDPVGISLFVYAENDTGTLLHFESFVQSSGDITTIKISLHQGIITISYGTRNNNEFQKLTIAEMIGLNQWVFVNILRTCKDIEFVDPSGKIKYVSHNHGDFDINLSGHLRIGGPIGNKRGDFVGRIGCLRIYKDSKLKWKEDLWTECYKMQKMKSINPCDGVYIKFIWPLNNQSLGYEALQATAPKKSEDKGVWLFADSVSGLRQRSAVLFNDNFNLEFQITSDVELKHSFSIAMFVYPTTSTLSQFLTIDQTDGCFNRMDASINSSMLHATISRPYGTTGITSFNIASDDWNFIAIQVHCYWKTLSVIVNSQYKETHFNYRYYTGPNIYALTPVIIGLGPFHGRMSCLSIFSAPLDELTAQIHLNQGCNKEYEYSAPAEDDPKPFLEWPLSETTYGYEVIRHGALQNPPIAQCWKFEQHAVVFYGSEQFYLRLDQTTVNVDVVTMGFLMKPDVNTSGTLVDAKLYYTSNSYYAINVKIDVNNLHLSVASDSHLCLFEKLINNHDWISIIIQFNSNTEVFVDNLNIIPESACGLQKETITRLDIILGKGNESTTDDFHGKIRCLSFFNTTLDNARSKELIINGCGLSNSLDLPDDEPTAATHVWSLTDTLPNRQSSNKDLLETKLLHSFDGSNLLHLLLEIPITNVSDVAVGIYIRPSNYSEGTILITENQQLKISIKMGIIQVIFGIDTSDCETLEFSGIESEEWHLLFMQRISSCQKLIVMVDDEKQFSSSTCLPSEDIGVMKIRLGGEPGSVYNFRGKLSCLALFQSTVSEVRIKDSMATSCNNTSNSSQYNTLVDDGGGYFDNTLVSARHLLIQANAMPSGEFSPFDVQPTRSISHCVGLCTGIYRSVCRSFVFQEYSNTTCTIYDFMITGGFEITPGARYYGLVQTMRQ